LTKSNKQPTSSLLASSFLNPLSRVRPQPPTDDPKKKSPAHIVSEPHRHQANGAPNYRTANQGVQAILRIMRHNCSTVFFEQPYNPSLQLATVTMKQVSQQIPMKSKT
jgi:hypothetical protein